MAFPTPSVAQPPTQDEPKGTPVGVVVQDEGVLILSTADGAFQWWLEGRLHVDGAFYGGGQTPLSNGVEIRRARIGFRMLLWKNWGSKFEVDFADSQAIVKDMWIACALSPRSTIKAGQFTEPFNLEQITSSRYNTFIERSLIAGLAPDRHVGIAYIRWAPRWSVTGGVFGQTVGQRDVSGDDQGYDLTGRVTVLPVIDAPKRRLLHLGIAGSYRTPAASILPDMADRDALRLALLPETHVSRLAFLDTGLIGAVNHYTMLGLEAAAVLGSLSFQAEWTGERIARAPGVGPDASVGGWYGFVSWFPTGEHRPYLVDSAEFGRVVPKARRGAFELLARYSTADLNDASAGVLGGRETIVTGGATWYFNPNIRLMVNVLRVWNDQYATGANRYPPNRRFTILQARLALRY